MSVMQSKQNKKKTNVERNRSATSVWSLNSNFPSECKRGYSKMVEDNQTAITTSSSGIRLALAECRTGCEECCRSTIDNTPWTHAISVITFHLTSFQMHKFSFAFSIIFFFFFFIRSPCRFIASFIRSFTIHLPTAQIFQSSRTSSQNFAFPNE